jgi:hypothetical protein
MPVSSSRPENDVTERNTTVARSDGKATDFSVAKGLAGWLLIGDDVRDDLVLAGDTQMVFVRPGRGAIPIRASDELRSRPPTTLSDR